MTTKFKRALLGGGFAVALGLGVMIGQATADQPFMHRGLGLLQQARATLAMGSDDHGGHRVAAIRDVDAAIAEVNAGIAFDRHH